jgi:hypothetical protein
MYVGGPYVETRGFIRSLSSLSSFSIVTRYPRKSYQQSPLQTIDSKAESSTPNNLGTCDRCAGLGRTGWLVGRWAGGLVGAFLAGCQSMARATLEPLLRNLGEELEEERRRGGEECF